MDRCEHYSGHLFLTLCETFECVDRVDALTFKYSSILFLWSYEEDLLKEHALQLLVLSHAYAIPSLKQLCEWQIEHGLLTIEAVIDIFQLAMLCDAPRLSLISHRFILKNFKSVCATEGWRVMKASHPVLENELLVSFIDEESVRNFYLLLNSL